MEKKNQYFNSMVRKGIILKIFSASYMQRWNDKLRPLQLIELDKHAHRMLIAYIIGKFHENDASFSWTEIIEGTLFELLQKTVLTDIKSPVLYRIKSDKEKYKKLNEFVARELQPFFAPLHGSLGERFDAYFNKNDDTLSKRILTAASTYASQWEFEIIKHSDPHIFDREQIEKELSDRLLSYQDLAGVQQLLLDIKLKKFIDLYGSLRFQTRWAGVHRIPQTSVLGHCLFVALLSYLFSLEVGACEKRKFMNFFTGLFHDFAEVLTRDIVNPVKYSVEGLNTFLLEYEREQMNTIVYPLIPGEWHQEFRLFTESEKESIIYKEGAVAKTTTEEISKLYNQDNFCPRDGEFIRLADELGAFVEAYEAIKNGCDSERFQRALWGLKTKYEQLGMYAQIPVRELFMEF